MMSESGFQIAVVGATGAMGEELLLTLERANLAISSFVPIASRASSRPSVEFRGQSFPVKPLGPDALEGVELAFAVLPQGPGDDLLIEAAEAGCTIVDLAGIWRDDPQVPMIALGINSALDLERVPNVGVVTSPGPVALALCAVAEAVTKIGDLVGITATAMLPAASAGRKGIEELSGQIVATFNSRPPPRAVFADGLAFDLIPAWGDVEQGGWTGLERLTAEQVGQVLGLSPNRVAVNITLAPLFAGMGISVFVRGDARLSAASLREALQGSRSVQLHDRAGRPLMPRAQLERAVVSVGRLRDDPNGDGVHLWIAADPMRLASANAVAIATELAARGLIGARA